MTWIWISTVGHLIAPSRSTRSSNIRPAPTIPQGPLPARGARCPKADTGRAQHLINLQVKPRLLVSDIFSFEATYRPGNPPTPKLRDAFFLISRTHDHVVGWEPIVVVGKIVIIDPIAVVVDVGLCGVACWQALCQGSSQPTS